MRSSRFEHEADQIPQVGAENGRTRESGLRRVSRADRGGTVGRADRNGRVGGVGKARKKGSTSVIPKKARAEGFETVETGAEE